MPLSPTFTYCNPHLDVEPGVVRDPFILRANGRYYLTGTLRPIWCGPNPGIPLWSSKDLLTWEKHGLIIDRNSVPEQAWFRDRFWAPEIHETDGWFYLTAGCRNETTKHRHGVSLWRAREITGPYEHLTPDAPFPPAENQFYTDGCDIHEKYISNDASLFTTASGEHHIFWSHYDGIWQAVIDLPSAKLIGEPKLALHAAKEGWDRNIEGPVLFQEGEWIYLFYSGFGFDYDMGVARSRSIQGPWETFPGNPLISPRPPLTHVGHNGVFCGPDGRWWITYTMQFNGKDSPERMAYDPVWITPDNWIATDAPTLGTREVQLGGCPEMT